ncbi:uncharacterized protein JCM15063_002031 [Sporobolomyces koalae]|uniref:uncharacterized protein n=1 Tax=Sporobolomyces koalae TaxID=500713 RepID=UPI0031760151
MASTAADTRGHVRSDSVAQKRARSTPTKPSSSRAPLASPSLRGSSSNASSSTFTVTPRLAIQTTVIALILFTLLHYGPTFVQPSNRSGHASVSAGDRKALLDGSGEGWILPKRWRQVGPGQGPVSLGSGETLPECKRVLLFRFSNTHGFSSEMLHYLRALVIGQKLGYTVLSDDSNWNYGSLSEYFLPRLVYCRPPADWFDPNQAVKLGTKRWQSKDRVWVSREMEREMDQWVREEMLDQTAMSELRDRKIDSSILPEGETLPAALEEVFADFSGVLKEVWRPNHQLAILVRKQRMELGLGGGGLRHRKNSPNWGGRRKKPTPQRGTQDDEGDRSLEDLAAAEEEYEQEYELHVAERSDRGPVIGAHLVAQSSNKNAALSQYGLVSRDAQRGNLTAVIEGANDAVKRLSSQAVRGAVTPGYSRSNPTVFPTTATATLVTLTSSSTLFDRFVELGRTVTDATLVRTSTPPIELLRQRWQDVFEQPGRGHELLNEWDQTVWNRNVPRALQIELTRYFVRDLTTLSKFADAFVVSGTSPTGVLSILLGGEEGAIGPRDFEGGSFGGRVRSIDGHWIPTANIASLYK